MSEVMAEQRRMGRLGIWLVLTALAMGFVLGRESAHVPLSALQAAEEPTVPVAEPLPELQPAQATAAAV